MRAGLQAQAGNGAAGQPGQPGTPRERQPARGSMRVACEQAVPTPAACEAGCVRGRDGLVQAAPVARGWEWCGEAHLVLGWRRSAPHAAHRAITITVGTMQQRSMLLQSLLHLWRHEHAGAVERMVVGRVGVNTRDACAFAPRNRRASSLRALHRRGRQPTRDDLGLIARRDSLAVGTFKSPSYLASYLTVLESTG